MKSGTSTPVTGAALTLYEAGTGYGSGATSLGTATSNGSGAFTISYTPPSPAAELYIVATGGNAGGGTNSAIGLMGVLGLSSAAPGSVIINEFTTVAGEWALAQFMDSTGTIIGAPSTNTTGLENGASQAQPNLADISSGSPGAFWTTYTVNSGTCAGGSPPVNCDGLKRMNTFANILASCVETSGPASAACTTLLTDTGSGSTTLQAANHMATHLTASISDLFGLQNGGSPFTPDLPSQPEGWELALNYTPTSSGFDEPSVLAIDASGNAWVTNEDGDSVTELTSSGALVGNYDPSSYLNSPYGIAIDASGNAWVANSNGNTVTKLSSDGSTASNYTPTGSDFDEPQGIAIDASGNAWVTNNSGNSVTELASAGTLVGNYDPSSYFDGPAGIAIDASGNAWVTNNSGNSVNELASDGTLVGNYTPTGANFDSPNAVAIDGAHHVWIVNEIGDSVTELTSFVGPPSLAGYFYPAGADFDSPNAVAIDSAGNVWFVNEISASVAEFIGAAAPVLTPLEACLKQSPPHAVCLP